MEKRSVIPFVLFLFVASISFGQRVKNEDLEYNYIQLPEDPVDRSITNYQSEVKQDFEAENARKRKEYEEKAAAAQAKFDKEEAEYPAKVQAAEDKYAAEMKAWEEKPIGEKIVEKKVLNENNKPVKQLPPRPYLQHVPEPKLQREYDKEALAGTYLVLDGFNNTASNALNIEVVMYGFEYTNPRIVTEQKSVVQSGTTKKVNYYHVEFTYRHTMSVRVTDPQGNQLMHETPVKLNNYTKYKGNASTKRPSLNAELLLADCEEKIVQDNLEFIRNLVNDKYGYKVQPRTVGLGYVMDKKGEYTDVTQAFNLTKSGLAALIDDKETAFGKLDQAIGIYKALLEESEMNNKKARINGKVGTPIYFNLLECYFAKKDMVNAEALLAEMNSISLSKNASKRKDEFEKLIIETKKRIAANK
jgi:hypothetical protein